MSATILIIEDNEQNLYMLRFLLERHGFTVVDARDGLAGIATAAKLRPDLILLDLQLPEMDGYSVATRLRSYPQLATTPVVAVTSYAMVGDRERVLAAGANGYIEKPIDPERFVEQIRAFLPDGI